VLAVDAARARRGPGAGAPFVASRDLWILTAIARSRLEEGDPVGRALAEKLERCVVLPPGAIASGVVTLGSRVVLGVGGRATQARVLVGAEEDHAFPRLALPVATPLGVAVLGQVAGSAVAFCGPNGSMEEVRIIDVADPPTAARGTAAAAVRRPLANAAHGEVCRARA
jgi:transcription elongation GreA/GreB family factor